MVNGVSMENVTSTFAIQILKTCTKVANIVSGGQVGGAAPGTGGSPSPAAHGQSECKHLRASGILSPFHSLDVEAQRGARVPQDHQWMGQSLELALPLLP